VRERAHWDDYQEAFKSAIEATATEKNPWYVVPADKKWYTRAVISSILLSVMRSINPQYPAVTKAQEEALAESKRKLKKMG
jgi:polyphosphate kinase 2 (PPK2 family)